MGGPTITHGSGSIAPKMSQKEQENVLLMVARWGKMSKQKERGAAEGAQMKVRSSRNFQN